MINLPAPSGFELDGVYFAFPFDQPRPGQIEAVTEVYNDLKTNDLVITCAPTGFGKSAFVLALANALGGGYVITPQNGLIDQYKADFEKLDYVGFMKSSSQFLCVEKERRREIERARAKRCGEEIEEKKDEGEFTCDDRSRVCLCRKGEEHPNGARSYPLGPCVYVEARDIALGKPVVIMTAAMASALSTHTGLLRKRPVLIVDESQRIESTLIDTFAEELDYGDLLHDKWDFEQEVGTFPSLKAPESEIVFYLREWTRYAAERSGRILDHPDHHRKAEVKRANRYKYKVSKILSVLNFLAPPEKPEVRRFPALPSPKMKPPPVPTGERWAKPIFRASREDVEDFGKSKKDRTRYKILCRPMAAIGLLRAIFGEVAPKIVLVSATPGAPDLVRKILGLPRIPLYREYGKPFPRENRRIIYEPTARLNRKASPEDWNRVIARVIEIAQHDWHARSKGIIHTVSGKLQRRIVEAFKKAGHAGRLIEVIGSENRAESIQRFKDTAEPAILIGPAVTDGLDLKGDICRWGIIPKVPWPNLGDASVKYRNNTITDWYAFQAILSIVQACGRNVRSESDWSINYILDASFSRLMDENRDLFPPWFYEAIESE